MLKIEYITNRIFNSRTYILTSPEDNRAWLVDCGDVDRVMERMVGMDVEGVLLTHTHSDHIYGLEELMRRFPKVKIYTNAYGVGALRSPKLNISRYHTEYPDLSIEAPANVCVVAEGDSLDVMGFAVQVYETPGHDPSCLTFITDGIAFTGDAYIPGVKVFTGFPHSNRKLALKSVERILHLTSNCRIMPGHTLTKDEEKTIRKS